MQIGNLNSTQSSPDMMGMHDMHPSAGISKFSQAGQRLEAELKHMEGQHAPAGQIMQKINDAQGTVPLHELIAMKLRRQQMQLPPQLTPPQSAQVQGQSIAQMLMGQQQPQPPQPQPQPPQPQGMPQQQQQQPPQQGPQMPFRHGGLAEIPVHNIGHEDRYARGGIIAFDQGGGTHDFMDRPGAHTIGQLPPANPSTNPASTPLAGGTAAPTSTPAPAPAGATGSTPPPAPTPAMGQVSTTPNEQGLYTDVVGGHTYSQATPWQQYQIDALNKEYATPVPAPAPAPATGQGIAGLRHRHGRGQGQHLGHPNQQQPSYMQDPLYQQNMQAYQKAVAQDDQYFKEGRLSHDFKTHQDLLDGKPYQAPVEADPSTYGGVIPQPHTSLSGMFGWDINTGDIRSGYDNTNSTYGITTGKPGQPGSTIIPATGHKRGGAIKHFAAAGQVGMPNIDDTSASGEPTPNFEPASVTPENVAAAEQAAATGDAAAISWLGKARSALNAGRRFNPTIPSVLGVGMKAIPRAYVGALPLAAGIRGAGDIYQGFKNIRSGDLAAGYTPTEDYYRMLHLDPRTHMLGNGEFGTTMGEIGVRGLGEALKYATFGLVQPRGSEPAIPKPTALVDAENGNKDSSPIDMSKLPAISSRDSGIGALKGMLGTPKTSAEELDYLKHLQNVADDKRKLADMPYADLLRQRHEADLSMGLGQAAKEGIAHADKMTSDLIASKPNLLAMDRLKGFAAMGMAAGARGNQPGYVGPGINGALTAAFQGLSAWSDAKEKTLNNYNNAMSKLYDDRYKYAAALENDNRAEMKDTEMDIKTRVREADASVVDLARERSLVQRDLASQRMENARLAASMTHEANMVDRQDPARRFQVELLERQNLMGTLDPKSPAGIANQARIDQLGPMLSNYYMNNTPKGENARLQTQTKVEHDLAVEFNSPLSRASSRANELVKTYKLSLEDAQQQVMKERLQEAYGYLGIGGGGGGMPTSASPAAASPSHGWGASSVVR